MSVTLNPEAPEFLPPEISATIEKGFVTMNKTIRLSNNLPVGGAYKQYQSVTDFDVVAQRFSHNMMFQLNSIFGTELPSFKLKENDFEYNMERLIDANDSILDRIYTNIDCVNKGVEPNRQTDNAVLGPGGYYSPKITKIQMDGRTFTAARNITRPQLFFKDRIDNTSAVWVPKITEKPNNIKPLALEAVYDEHGNHIGFKHPYLVELSNFTPRPEWLAPAGAPTMPPPVEQTKITMVSTEEQLDELLKHLRSVEEIGVDLEHHSYRSYQGFTCLMQMTTYDGDFIVDALACREHLHKLNEVFTNPNILKIFHGSDSDVTWLQKDFGIYLVGMFDTFRAAKVLNMTGKSLAALLKRYCGVDTDKSYQLADWRLRPLTPDMVKYARIDTHYLPYIWRRMRADLLKAASGDHNMLLKAFELSKQVCRTTYNKPVTDEDSHLSLYQSNRPFNAQQMAALRVLYRWRDEEARKLDESTTYLLPNHMLVALAENLPRDVQGVTAVCQPMPPFVKQNLDNIHKMILSCREISLDSRLHVGLVAARLQPPPVEYAVHDVGQHEDEDDEGVTEDAAGSSGLQACHNLIQVRGPAIMQSPWCGRGRMVWNPPGMWRYYGPVPYYGGVRPFLPPYSRHNNYKILGKEEEMRTLKEKEAKILAISKGNKIIQSEILAKLEQIKAQVQMEQNTAASDVAGPSSTLPPPHDHRQTTLNLIKTKIWTNKNRKIDRQSNVTTCQDESDGSRIVSNTTPRQNPTPYNYNNTNYSKFRHQK
ncbi:exosome complex component 10 homolog isoform X3 [Maniola hyperantus]|uniref:exosome complex component 10 homolog isoform X3 n=1 Tax=Aphantopus hyperantus TaxID=2795564 RepID=UPI00213A71B7